jgi:hypothetical protein
MIDNSHLLSALQLKDAEMYFSEMPVVSGLGANISPSSKRIYL